MKNTVKTFGNPHPSRKAAKVPLGIIALVAVIGFSMAACDGLFGDDEGGDDIAVTFSGVTPNGSITQTTTQLTLTFSQAITGLSASNITLSGVNVSKGTLSGSGPSYTLPISGFTAGGTLSVAVAKSGYAISGSPKMATIYYYSGGGGGTIAAPTNVTATAVSSTSISISWNAVPGAIGYTLWHSSSATGEYTATGNASETSPYLKTGLTPNTTYYYKVMAVDASGGISELSAYATATTLPSDGGTPVDLPASYHGTWISTTGLYQPYTLTISANTVRFEDKDGDFIQYANAQFTAAANTNSTHRTQHPNGYTFTGTKTASPSYGSRILGFIALSADEQKVYLGVSDSEEIIGASGPIFTKQIGGGGNDLTITNTAQWEAALATISGEPRGNYTLTISGNVGVPGFVAEQESTDRSFGTTADGSTLRVNLKGSGKLFLTSKGSIIRIGANQTLDIDSAGLTLEGLTSGKNGASEDNNVAAVYIDGDGTLLLKNGTISGNTSSESQGSGVYVGYSYEVDWELMQIIVLGSGTFTMSGGKITGNKTTAYFGSGGGVFITTGGIFNMEDGEISGNNATGGGGVHVYGGTFTMDGGEITDNTSTEATYGGGGVWVGGTFTMNNGKITGNNAKTGGGVYLYGSGTASFIMNNGEITGNTATERGGGGVYQIDGTVTMKNGKISGNTASRSGGGGVYTTGGTFTMEGGRISGNTFTYTSNNGYGGGGVYVLGTFIMKAGIISGNTATVMNGGGVYVDGTFQIVNGTIYGSNASGKDVDGIDLKNTTTSYNSGAALYIGTYNDTSGTAERGTFTGADGAWVSKGNLISSGNKEENTITVVNGDIVQ